MKTNVELIQSLQDVLDADKSINQKLIEEFQEEIWNDEGIHDENLNEILSELAYDLDFYEPNKEWRKEAPSYYGDDRLEEVLKTAMRKISIL